MNIGTLMLFIAHGLERSLEFKQRYVLILNMFSWNLTKGQIKEKEKMQLHVKEKKMGIIDMLMVKIHE